MVACLGASVKEEECSRLEKAATEKKTIQIAKFKDKQARDIKQNRYIGNLAGTLLTLDKNINEQRHKYYTYLLSEEFPHEPLICLPSTHCQIEEISVE